jgi:ribosomal protein S4
MTNINKYKPRYALAHLTKTRIWPYKDGYLRNFFRIRARWVKPKGRVQRYIMVAKNMKWTEARNFFRPNSIRIGKKLIFNKSAYGRPQSISRRYNNLFYIKQKLRFFHGKVKETAFRNLYKTHLIQRTIQTNSFFTVLESRLDRIFFRIRLLPTVFACHQFIHYNGLEINNKLERSPRKEIKVGDIVSVPIKAWIAFYWYVYYRIYYRRWGRYILKRRLIKKVKKLLFFNFNNKLSFKKNIVPNWKQIKGKTRFIPKAKSKFFINKINTLTEFFEKYTVLKSKPVSIIESEETNTIINENGALFTKLSPIIEKLKQDVNFIKDKAFQYRLKTQIEMLQQLFVKVKQYQKLYFNSYFFSEWKQKYLKRAKRLGYQGKLKWVTKLTGYKKINVRKFPAQEKKRQIQVQRLNSGLNIGWKWGQVIPRKMNNRVIVKKSQKNLAWLFWKILKKKKRKKITIRLKPVHFFIPSYLQIDFRTLSVIKIKSPLFKDRHYPFQISLSKTYSFYKSRGF